MKYVYELYDIYGTVVYVGETKDPNRRLREHTKKSKGKFFGQQLTIEVVASFETKKEAWDYQIQLQKQYGLVTDNELVGNKKGSKIHSVKHKQDLSKRMKGNTYSKGYTHTSETKQKISQLHKGKIVSEETKQKMRVVDKATAKEIQDLYDGGNWTMQKLAEKYNSTYGTVRNIVKRKNGY